MPPPRACLLDYGNTIVAFDRPQIEGLQRAFAAALGRLAVPIEVEVLGKVMDRVCALPLLGEAPDLRELTPARQMEILLAEAYGGAVATEPALVAECDQALQELFVEAIHIEPSTVEYLRGLSRRVRVGLVSNYPCGQAIRRSLRKIGIYEFLDPIVVSGEVGYVKPHPTCFAPAITALGLPPGDILFVGDRWDADMIGARDAGMKTCHHVGFTSDRDLDARYAAYRPDYRIERLEDLDTIL